MKFNNVADLIRVLGCLLAGVALHSVPAATFDVAQFGALGDGVHDDGPAIRKAIAAAIQATGDSRVVLARKSYRLAEFPDHEFQLELRGVSGLTIEGNGAQFINTPRHGLLLLNACTNVVVRNFELDYDPLPFTQGTIRAVNPAQGSFSLELQAGYPLPPADEQMKQLYGAKGWEWGSVIDPVERHRRWDVSDHYFIDSVVPLPGAERTYQVVVSQAYAKALQAVRPGDRFFLPLRYGDSRTGAHSQGSNLAVQGSSDCRLENITLFSARCGMDFAIGGNEGRITLRGIRITFKPGSDRLVTTWRDGMHCKDNRVGPCIEDCFFEGMLDDSVNLGANTAMATRVLSSKEFQLTGARFREGDVVMVYDPPSGRLLAGTKVAELRTNNNQRTVVLEQPVPGVVVGQKRPHLDIRATHFYNMSYCGRDFVIRNCTFGPQRRHALLLRAPVGLVEGNTMNSVGGSAVHLGNEFGSFYEGPFPCRVVISNNVIRNPQGPAILINTESLCKTNQQTQDIRVLNNRLTLLPDKPGITVRKARDIVLRGNQLQDGAGRDLGAKAIEVTNSLNVTID